MARKKQKPILENWDQVNESLKEIGEINRKVQAIEADMNETINMVKANAEDKSKSLLFRRKELESNVQKFTEYHTDQFKDAKTKSFNYGEVGFRKATSIITRNVKAIIEALKQNKMDDCIKRTESIDKEELAKYDDKSIEKVGARRKVEEKFFYKIDEERVEA